jgi:hypothetical protein
MMIPAIPGGAAIGMLPAAGYAALQLARKKPVNMKTLGYTLGAGAGIGAIGGAIAGDRLDKKMKTGRYERLRRGDTINAKTYVKGGWFGLGLSKGKPLKVKSTGNDQKDAIKLAKTFYNREKKAGRM